DLQDADFGSGAPLALPEQYFGTPAIPKLVVAVGKEGIVYLLNRDDLGGYRAGANQKHAGGNRINADAGAWARAAVWPGDGGWVYLVPNAKRLNAFRYGFDGDSHPSLALAGRSEDRFGYTSGSPIVTSNALQSGSALVWMLASDGPYGNGELRAYDTVP